MRYLLDTCTFIWIVEGMALPHRVEQLFRDPDNEFFLSAASCWEIAMKYALGRLPLSDAPERIVPLRRAQHGILPLPVDEESALHISRLPQIHRDRTDRLLVAQAVVHGLTIVTPDERIPQYGVRSLW